MKLRYIFACILMLAASVVRAESDCSIDISIADITKGDVVPSAISSKLEGKLTQALGKAGMISAPYDSRFFVAGRFDDAYKDNTGGPSPKVYVKTTLTLYVGDAVDEKIFASESFELSGAGSTEQMAYQRALNSIGGGNSKIQKFLAEAHQKIIDYYDANYQKYINDAKKAMAARNYEEALYYAGAIPSCSKGYNEANALAMQIYKQNMNHEGQQLLAKARGAWAADPSADGAAKAYEYLSMIDPESTAAAEAKALGKEISKRTQKQWDFENVTKYQNAVELEKHRMNTIRDINRAWASSRPKRENRYYFISRY